MRTYASMQTLVQELETDAAEIERVLERNRTAYARIQHGADDPVDWGALGFTIQTLVERMKLEIPGVRPAFLQSSDQERQAREMLRFRHRLRHLYGEDLDPAKTTAVQTTVQAFFERFPSLHTAFTGKLRSIADAL
jgi:hypothetical protein